MIKTHHIVLIALATMLFSSCGIYKKYERADIHFVDSLYRRMSVPTDSTSSASVTWEEFFTDKNLQDWIRLGLQYNSDLRIAQLKVQEAQAALTASSWALFPGVDLNMKAGLSGEVSANLEASWQTDIFGSMRNSKRKAQAALAQSEAYKQAVQTQLVATIAKSYYTLLKLDEQLSISKNTLEAWEESVRTLEALKHAGKTTEAAVLQAKANMLNVEASVLTLEKEILAVENSLCALLSIVPMSIKRSTLNEQVMPTKLCAGVPVELLDNRPDVKQAEMAVAQAYYAVNSAKANFYPNITLSGALGWTSGNITVDPGSIITNLIASLTQPVFGRGVNKARLEIAQAQYSQAACTFRQSLLDAGVEVNNALTLWQTAQKRVELDKKQILNLQAAIWNTQLLMKHGNADYLEVLTAQKSLLQAELTEASDKYDEIISAVNLYQALGGGY